jgi:hypothetical protein
MPDEFPLRDVPRYLPTRDGKKIHVSAPRRWASPKGLRVAGQTVRLESFAVAGRLWCTAEALRRFLAACDAARTGRAPQTDAAAASPARTPAARQRDSERAAAELKAIGV